MTDQDVINWFWSDKLNDINSQKYRFAPIEYKQYIENRYNDSTSYKESLRRIYLGIEKRPVCEICGKPVEFLGKKGHIYRNTCSLNCYKIYLSNIQKNIFKGKTKEEKEKIKEKTKQTCLERYGVENPFKSEKIKKKIKNTFTIRYNSDCTMHAKELKEKVLKTNLIKYGSSSPFGNKDIQIKSKETLNKHYNVNHPSLLNTNNFKTNNPQKNKYIKEKTRITNNLLYGGNSPTCDKNVYLKQRKSMHENNSFNKSNEENICFKLLCNKFNNIIRQYSSDLYPFNCDFYIPSINLYIEYQGSHFHHFHPFNENNINDINELNRLKKLEQEELKIKNKTQYTQIINTWTIRDVNKRNIAKQNNLNWIEFFTIDELKEWLKDK